MPEQKMIPCPECNGKPAHRRPAIERFATLSPVRPDGGCWMWAGRLNHRGYGQFYMDGKMHQAHRASYLLFVGDIAPGLYVCHTCDNPGCVNPAHLWAGTAYDNAMDMRAKGRAASTAGDLQGNAKLKESDIPKIRAMRATGDYTMTEIGAVFGVSKHCIYDVISRTGWKHVR